MKQFLPGLLLLAALGACSGDSEIDDVEAVEVDVPDVSATVDLPNGLPDALGADGKVLITVERLIPEEQACLVMMNVANGTDETVTAGLFAFDVTGNGESAGANMFPQTAEPGTMTTAQIILPNADCANVQAIEGGQLNCKIAETGESCVDQLELRDGIVDFTAND